MANNITTPQAPSHCPSHGNKQAGMPRRYGDVYRWTCGCSTGIKRGN